MQRDAALGWLLFAVLVFAAGAVWYWQRARRGGLPLPPPVWALCQECDRYPAMLWCRVHQLRLCWGCLRKHDVVTECSYRPIPAPGR